MSRKFFLQICVSDIQKQGLFLIVIVSVIEWYICRVLDIRVIGPCVEYLCWRCGGEWIRRTVLVSPFFFKDR